MAKPKANNKNLSIHFIFGQNEILCLQKWSLNGHAAFWHERIAIQANEFVLKIFPIEVLAHGSFDNNLLSNVLRQQYDTHLGWRGKF